MLNVRFLVNVTEAEHHDASVSKETETLARSSREVLCMLRNTVRFWVVQRIWYINVRGKMCCIVYVVVGLALVSASRRTKECEGGMLGSARRRLESRPEARK
ncbi:hypothetical protein NDU88_006955 [Pleurodeles waltl]|uniref:Uncharacterized protein n=1 Tax=Pleurodeles waltl TaxID=8319 RepID=A0AAV7QMM9_PLEWA|nr:hypothetical protein NDU88_006955 [Pleurodeles waltl]